VSPAELFADLIGRGFTLARKGDGIQVGPASRLTADLRNVVRANRAALLWLLDLCERFAERVAIAHHDGGLSWENAEAVALADVLSRAGSLEEADAAVQADLFTPAVSGPYGRGL
jgi:hypothetical protein